VCDARGEPKVPDPGDDADGACCGLAARAVAALQIQTAQVGARMADMSNDGTRTQTLEAIATDYEGVSGAALNLSIRCSVTVVDLCAAALGRLCGRNKSRTHEWGANNALGAFDKAPASITDPLLSLIDPYLKRLRSTDWASTSFLRNEVTHKAFVRGITGTFEQSPRPRPIAWPAQLEFKWGSDMVPLDQLSETVVRVAVDTFREFCTNLIALA
jgi:hypothetical protein